MSQSTAPATEAQQPQPSAEATRARRKLAFTTTTIVSFSLTLLAGSIAVLAGMLPISGLTRIERIDVGAVLFAAPILALVLAIMFEATRIAFTRKDLPEPRRQDVIRWTPGRREG
ncbi:MAG: hypothetical protein EOP22_13215 [Hyphomicrobiales bacterium]|nr:MAG: hypothetical protein EOP22_13215 [Hyphomicrobiales bacterium]